MDGGWTWIRRRIIGESRASHKTVMEFCIFHTIEYDMKYKNLSLMRQFLWKVMVTAFLLLIFWLQEARSLVN